ncbi:MAG: PAS domain S-box protein [Thermogutta sp.]
MNSLIDHWEDLFQPEYQVLVTSKTFAHLCPLVWVEQSPDHKGAPVFREVLFSSVTPEVETEVFRVVQTIPEFEHSRRRILVGHPDWMVLVVPGPQGYPYRLLGGVINTRVLDQDSTIPPLLKNFLLSPDVQDHEVLIWLLLQVQRFRQEKLEEAKTHIEHLVNERAALKESHAEAVARAIAEREERIREQEEYYRQIRAVMMKAADGIVTVDAAGFIRSINEAAEQIFGFSSEELIGHPIQKLLPNRDAVSKDLAFPEEMLGRARNLAQAILQIRGQKKDGTPVDLELSISRVSLGREPLYTFILRDVTVRKRLEEQERQIHLLKQTILNAAADGIVGVDQAGRVTFVNPAAAAMLGFSPEEIVGQVFHEVVHHSYPDGRPYPAEKCPLTQLPDGTSGFEKLTEEIFWRKDKTSFPVECAKRPIHEGERVTGVVITFRDISLRRMLEAKLRQAQKLESIGQLAAGIAHEINTPTQYIGDNISFVREAFAELSPLLGLCSQLRAKLTADEKIDDHLMDEFLATLRRTDVDYIHDEIPQALAEAMEGVNSVAKIVQSMREFSHPGAEAKQSVDFNRCVENTVTVSKNEWKYVAEMQLDLDHNLPPVSCFPNEINQLLLNLIVNAAHAIEEKIGRRPKIRGLITISTRQVGEWVELRVRDTGTGIPEAIRSRIFDPFFTTKPVGKGTGQGLAIAHSIVVEKHHGTIDFETTPGEGTTFVVRIPVKQSLQESIEDELQAMVKTQ